MRDHEHNSDDTGAVPATDSAAGAARSAWTAYRRLLRITTLVAGLAAAAALAWLTADGAPVRWELWAAVAGGVAGTVMLSGALMGLAFLSARSGHDASVDQPDHHQD